ncbi:putative gustatory receptor 98b [Stomoxys calcitrans]|uniref:putative gustatory receptor 98b n=1 Tax=Stomoxys calcitrans TaxID=35570 RepID=UPI0027E22588|nr:putative gustatory receptor 98b [Stomoxys calcitrans]
MKNNFNSKEVVASHLLKAILPFQWVYACCGLALPPTLMQATYKDKSNKFALVILWIFFILYSVMVFTIICYMVHYNNVSTDIMVNLYGLDCVTRTLAIIQNSGVPLVQLAIVLSTLAQRQRLINIYSTINQLEQDILLFLKNNEYVTTWMQFSQRCSGFGRHIFYRCALCDMVYFFALFYTKYPVIWKVLPYRDQYLTLISFHLMLVKFAAFRVMMYVMYEFINVMEQSLGDIKNENILRRNFLATGEGKSSCYKKLLQHQILLCRVWSLAHEIENYFSLPMLVLFLYYGANITHVINWMYIKSFVHRFCYLILLFVNILWTCWLSQMCIDKYNRIDAVLSGLKLNINDKALKNRHREYTLEFKHQKLLFTCWGFFDLNLKYFGLMVLAIMTYVFILIQFKLQTETEKATRL